MTTQSLAEPDSLQDFLRRDITFGDETKSVLISWQQVDGEQMALRPAVIVMAEMPGISPHVARFARWVRNAGFTVYMPSLFGNDGAIASARQGAEIFQRACVSAEFRAFANNESSPITIWLRALARLAHRECGGPGVGAIGMCFTGNFALSMMLEPAVIAPVLCQPSLPLNNPAGIEMSASELLQVKQRLDLEQLTVLGFRFAGDLFCRAERFAAYQPALGNHFVARVLPDDAANTELPPFFARHVPCPHSVVTAHLIDQAGQPTIAARDEILAFFAERLLVTD
jgi:dienelactone hydrolase